MFKRSAITQEYNSEDEVDANAWKCLSICWLWNAVSPCANKYNLLENIKRN